MLRNVLRVLVSDLFLLMRRIFGCRVTFNLVSIVSPIAVLRTKSGGKINLNSKVGIRPGTEISATHGEIYIGRNCFINRNCLIVAHESVVLKDNVTIGPGTYIYDHDHDGMGSFTTKKIVIGENVWIGAGCIILKGVTIGKDAVIAAGTIVTKDVPDNTIIRSKCEYVIKELEDK